MKPYTVSLHHRNRLWRLQGALLWAAFGVYGGGAARIAAGDLVTGGLLVGGAAAIAMVLGGVGGSLLAPTMPAAATLYTAARSVEAALLAVGAVVVLSADGPVGSALFDTALATSLQRHSYLLAMGALVVGAAPVCLALARRPARGLKVFGWWGLVGYAGLGAGVVVAVIRPEANADVIGALPGGLWEFVVGALLMARGAPRLSDSPPQRSHP